VSEFLVNTLTHPAFTAIIGFLAGHFLAMGRDRRKEFNEAAAKFREAFAKIRKTINDSHPGISKMGQTDFFMLFTESYDRQYEALIHFKDHLSRKQQEALEKTWEQHCWNGYFDEKESHGPFLHYHYISETEMRDGEPFITKTFVESFAEVKNLANSNIEKLLAFAKPK
jgi:hypothetical protein